MRGNGNEVKLGNAGKSKNKSKQPELLTAGVEPVWVWNSLLPGGSGHEVPPWAG